MSNGFKFVACYVLGPISTLASGLMFWTHIKFKKLREHPGTLVLIQCLTQCILDFIWILNPILHSPGGVPCLLVQALDNAVYIGSCNYMLALSVEVYSTIKNPLKPFSKLRKTLYHTFCLGFSFVYFASFILHYELNYDPADPPCFLASSKIAYDLFFLQPVYFLTSTTIIGVCLFKIWEEPEKHYMVYHSLVVIAFNVCWGPSMAYNLLKKFKQSPPGWFEDILWVLGASSGLLIFLARGCEPKMFKQVWKSINFRKNPKKRSFKRSTLFQSLLPEEAFNPYVLLFESLLLNKVSKILLGLSFLFTNRKSFENYMIKQPNAAYWKFEIHAQKKIRYKVKEYFPEPFEILRGIEGISSSDLIDSLEVSSNLKDLSQRTHNPGGRSGSFFYFTADKKYILKTITHTEMGVLRTLFKSYFDRAYSQSSLMARIYGMFKFKLKGTNILYIILMENVLSECTNPVIFDLKGSSFDREKFQESFESIEVMPRNTVMKDLDFFKTIKTLSLEDHSREIFEAIEKDTFMLQSFGIMDYSLLVGIEFSQVPGNSKYLFYSDDMKIYLAIIDYTQIFNYNKRLERSIKKIKSKSASLEISSVSPIPYRERFLSLIKLILDYEEIDDFYMELSNSILC